MRVKIFFSIIGCLYFVVLMTFFTIREKSIVIDDINVIDLTKEYVYVIKDEEIVKKTVYIENSDVIEEKFTLLTSSINKLGTKYSTAVSTSTKLLDYKIVGNRLILLVSSEYSLTSDLHKAEEQINSTYKNDLIKEIIINIID